VNFVCVPGTGRDTGAIWGWAEDGGETSREVMSTEGDRARLEPWEEGDGESEGTGGGGRTKWNVRDAICICDLQGGQGH
jgi:hypothetical protein